MLVTAAQVRALTLTYHKILELIDQPLLEETRDWFNDFLQSAAAQCDEITKGSAPGRWAKGEAGPVLAAAMGAAIHMRDRIPTASRALRVFGLHGDKALTNSAAWTLMQPYLWEPVLSPQAVAKIRHQCGLQLKLPDNPNVIDVLEEVTRPRTGAFPAQVAHWLADYFQSHAGADTPSGQHYRRTLADLQVLNERKELLPSSGARALSKPLTTKEWQALIDGHLPQYSLESKAGYAVARQFVSDYWTRWNSPRG